MEERMKIINIRLTTLGADCSGRAVYGVGLRPPNCWDFGFELSRGHGCFSLVSVVCCQVELSASLCWSLFRRSPIKWGVSECDQEVSIMRRPWALGAVAPWVCTRYFVHDTQSKQRDYSVTYTYICIFLCKSSVFWTVLRLNRITLITLLKWLKFTFFNQHCILKLFSNFEKHMDMFISILYRFQLECYFRFGTLSFLSWSIPISFSVKLLSWGLRLIQVAYIQYVDGCRNWVWQSNPRQPTKLRSWHFLSLHVPEYLH